VRQQCGILAGRVASHEAPPLVGLLEDSSWRLTGSVERPRRADAHGAGRRRKRDEQEELGERGHAAPGTVARGETAREASECGSGRGRLGACDCKAVRDKRCGWR
jgi:hypothetical protein